MSNTDLFQLLGKFADKNTLPPVSDWHPERVGEIDIVIKANGEWIHEGGKFERQDLARLFASILRKDGDEYFLVTPAEKLKITVEDAPFVIPLFSESYDHELQNLNFITNMGDEVVAGSNHPLEFAFNPSTEETIPYILVRDNLKARIKQNVFYQLIELAKEKEVDGETYLVLESSGVEFKVCPI